MKKNQLAIAVVILLGCAAAQADTLISVESGGIIINSYAVSPVAAGTFADPWLINEDMASAGIVRLDCGGTDCSPIGPDNQTEDPYDRNFGKWFQKTVYNASDFDWTSFELELQIVLGEPSVNGDGLSFVDCLIGNCFIYSSDKFAAYTTINDTKDYLNFHDGVVPPGETVTFWFAVSDGIDYRTTELSPIYLAQTPNRAEVPEPSTTLLLGLGLVGIAVRRRKFLL